MARYSLNENEFLEILARDSGNGNLKGVQVSVIKYTIDGDFISFMGYADGNFRFIALPYKRKNQKAIDKTNLYIQNNIERLASYWLNNNYGLIIDDIKENI